MPRPITVENPKSFKKVGPLLPIRTVCGAGFHSEALRYTRSMPYRLESGRLAARPVARNHRRTE
jgi:hypothetical protein